ncbi:hypothetical protein C8R43DRAFT_943066 [Mycena crocata]|nr:hypothetical protein C8R43DRAFT_943066 [Mycena crocata]
MSQIAPASTVPPSASPSDVTSNPLDGAQGVPPRATAALANTPTVIISEGSVGDLDSIPPKDKERRNATPGPSSRRDAGESFIDSIGLRPVSPDKKLLVAQVQAEARANQRELHALAQGMARHVSTAERHWEEITSVLDGLRNDILGVQMSLAEHGVADAAKNPIHLSLAIANDPLIQQLVADARSGNHRFVQLENARQSDQQRLAQVEESALDLQRKILDRLDRLDRLEAVAAPAAPSALPQIYVPPISTPSSTAPSTTPVPGVVLSSQSSTDGRLLRMEGMLQQMAANIKRPRSPSPTPDSRAVCHHLDDSFAPAAAASASPQETAYTPGVALPAGISAASAPATFTHAPAPAFTDAPPAFLHPVSSAPPAGIIYAAPVLPPGVVQAVPQVVAHTAMSATSTPPPGIVQASGDAAARGRNNQPVAPRNPAAEVYLGPWDWVKDITKQASAIMRTVLPKQDLRNAFERAHRYGPQYIACAFKTPEQAAWFIDAFNAARVSVRGYEALSASAFPK